MVLKEIKILSFLPCDSCIRAKMAVFTGDWPNWLPTDGHTLAKTHIYKSKIYFSENLLVDRSVLCVSMVLCLILDSPEPWLGPVVCMKILSSCSYPPGQWCNCEHREILGFPFLLLSDWSYSVFCHGRSKFSTATMSCIQISNTLVGYCWCVVKPFIAVLMLYSSDGAVVLWGVPYIGWAHGPRYGWSMRQASAMLLVPDKIYTRIQKLQWM